ncbi:hypothetical protein [Geobacter sp. SVR]|uniref:hypothetical protein n=1 Tax=Geobacter sp. SVR TaxID=2495594 RepID=UPI00143F032E|nr:hypothetical protein [Geobacter sp. SVR]BCS53248.1 hypothetical protein GSVR_15560 [Geobacter sp. SVR]GCF84634.1 hypothetical protein GSbR_12340 [Geobacter sp. SVR]
MKRTIIHISLACLLLSVFMLAGCGDGSGGAAAAAKVAAAPADVTATSGINKITLSWNPVAGADSYNIYWSDTPGPSPATGTKIAGVTSPYVHEGLFVSKTYFYVVTAVSHGVESPASSQAATVAATDGANLYSTLCAGCHGPVTATSITNGTPNNIKAAIASNTGGMGTLSYLTDDTILAIANMLPCH